MKRINFMVSAALAFSWALLAAPLPAQFVYIANRNSDNISAYSLNPKTGFLTAISGSPFSTGVGPFSVALHPTNRFLYVTNLLDNTVSGYSIDDKTGALTAVEQPFATGQFPNGVAVDPLGRFAYVTNANAATVSLAGS